MDFSYNELQTMLADSIGKFIDNEYDFDARHGFAGSARGFSDEVLSVAERPDRALAEAARVLKPGARILIVDRIAGNSPGLDTAGLAAQFADLDMRPLRSVPLRLASATLMVMLVQMSDVRRPAA